MVKEAVQQYSRDLLQDGEIANRVQQEAVWEAVHKLRQPVDQEQQMAKVPSMVEALTVRDLDDTMLDEVFTRTSQVALLEHRLVGMEQDLWRVQEAAESCGLAMQNNVEPVRSSAERLSQLDVDRDDIQAARVSLTQEQETLRKVVARDLVRLAKDKVRTKEDLETYHWAKALDLDTGNKSRESSAAESDSDTSRGWFVLFRLGPRTFRLSPCPRVTATRSSSPSGTLSCFSVSTFFIGTKSSS